MRDEDNFLEVKTLDGLTDVKAVTKLVFPNGSLTDDGSGEVKIAPGLGGANAIAFIISGGGAVITTGSKGFLVAEFACTINTWTIIGDQSGSCVLDIKRSTYAGFPTTASIIGGGNAPTLSSAQKNQAAPSGWTSIALNAGDILEFSVSSVTTLQRILLSLNVTRT